MTNGTEAKDIAIYFFEKIKKKPTSSDMKKTVPMAKKLLKEYTKTEILWAINLYTDIIPPFGGMHSLGYLFYGMPKAIEIKKANEMKEKIAKYKEKENKPKVYQESDTNGINRNKEKLARRNTDTRKRKKYSLDLFKQQ